MTKTYIGVKVVTAWPQMESEAFPNRAFDETDSGADRHGYAVKYADGYTSWSPKDVFEAAYREVPEDCAQSMLEALMGATEQMAICAAADPGDGDMALGEVEGDSAAYHQMRQRDARETAVHLAAKILGGGLEPFSSDDVFNYAARIASYVLDGTVAHDDEAIEAAYQRGYNAARPLDPATININPGEM